IFSSMHRPELMLLALAAALFHTLNHATFKSLLFLSAGSVIHGTHTRNIEEYGGLIKCMPMTGLFFLVGSMAISALPPFNGFFSEWLTFQSLFSGLATADSIARWAFLLAAASLAVTGGLALACFVKAFGAAFLARPRSNAAKKAKESARSMRVGMAGLAALCLVIGFASAPVASVLLKVSRETTAAQQVTSVVDVSHPQALAVGSHGTSVSGPAVLALVAAAPIIVWLVVRYGVNRRQKVATGDTWDCGTPLTPRMEITATGFAHSIILMFQGFIRPTLHHRVEYHSPKNPYLLKSRTVHMTVRDAYQAHLYKPAYRGMFAVSRQVKRIQNGNLNAYVLYMFIILILVLVVEA
ncbi:MAG TPA: proton-conducting transporter membrane subunit, partial [Candidatus Saccharimonadales bacterium]